MYVGQVVADEKLSDHPALLPPDDPEAEKFLSRTTHVMVATDLFEQANSDWRLANELRLILLMIAAEALLSDDERRGVRERLAQRLSTLTSKSSGDQRETYELTREVYRTRSDIVHGAAYRREWRRRTQDGVLINYGFNEISANALTRFNDLVRQSLQCVIALGGSKEELLARLDRAASLRHEIVRLQREVSEYWGRPPRPNDR